MTTHANLLCLEHKLAVMNAQRLGSASRLAAIAMLITLPFTGLNAASAVCPKNAQLLSALEPLEGLTEAALGGKANKIQRSLDEAATDRPKVRELLGSSESQFDTLFGDIYVAQKKGNTVSIALDAAELYKLVASTLDSSALVVPREVSLLDYVGFRTEALLKGEPIDWNAIAATAQEANGYWAAIRQRVTDAKLQAAMDRVQKNLGAAAAQRSPNQTLAAVRADLDLVDELESYFSR